MMRPKHTKDDTRKECIDILNCGFWPGGWIIACGSGCDGRAPAEGVCIEEEKREGGSRFRANAHSCGETAWMGHARCGLGFYGWATR
jgi:hypothetical protein